MTWPELRKRMYNTRIIEVGYWRWIWDEGSSYAEKTRQYPDPNDLILDEPYDPELKERLLAFLDDSKHMRVAFRGAARCRCCSKGEKDSYKFVYAGTEDVSDGVYRWPSGLSHYVDVHEVDLPKDFVRHATGWLV